MVASRSASLVGRVEQLALLRQLAADVARRRPAVAVVLGEAGIGKTRLVDELAGSLDRAVVARGGCSPGAARDLPLAPVAEVLADLRRALGPRFGRLGSDGMDPAVAALLPDLAASGSEARVSSQAQLFDAVVRLLRDVGRARTLVLVVEDVHWADRTSRELLEYLARSLRDEHVLLVLTARTHDPAFDSCQELVANVGGLRHAVRLTLPRLTAEEVAEHVRALRGTDHVGATGGTDVAKVFALSEGVPLLVEEVVDADLDDVGSLADLLLGHRLGRLSPAARAVVESAAVAALEPSTDALARTSPVAPEVFDDAFGEAVTGGVLVRRQSGGRAVVGFRHALLREATLVRVMPNAERDLHRRWSEEIGEHPEGLTALVAAAHHRHHSGDLAGALAAYYRASLQAGRLSAYAEQKQLLLRVADLWPQVPDAEARTGAVLANVYGEAAWCANLLMADLEEGKRLLDAAMAATPPEASAHDRGMLALLWHRLRRNTGDHLSTEEVLAAAAAIRTEPPSESGVIAAMEAADAVRRFGDPEAAEAHARRGVALAERTGAADLMSRALGALSETLVAGRKDAEALRAAERAVVLADRTGDLFVRMAAMSSCRYVQWMTAQPGILETDERLVELLGGDRPGPMPGRWGLAQLWRAGSLFDIGRWQEAAGVLDSVLAEPLPDWLLWDARLCADHLAVRRGQAASRVPEDPVEPVDDSSEVDLDDVVATRYFDADIAAHAGDLTRARAHVASVLGDDRIAEKPSFLYQLLEVAARVEAETAVDGERSSPPEDGWVARRVRHLLELAPPRNRRQRAYAAHALADLDRSEGHDRPETWEGVVSCWRDAGLPFPLATALVRAGAAQAGAGRPGVAQGSLREAVEIAERLGARPLVDEALAVARRWHLRVGTATAPAPLGLTARELDVLRLLAEGASNAAIARTLVISPKTASVHVSNILAKLDVPNRAAAAAVAHRSGLVAGA